MASNSYNLGSNLGRGKKDSLSFSFWSSKNLLHFYSDLFLNVLFTAIVLTLKSLRIFATMIDTPLKEAPMTPVIGLAWPAFHTPLLAAHDG